jgi:hypothetical protein
MMESLANSDTTHQCACLADPRPIYVYSTNKEHEITRLPYNILNHGDIVKIDMFPPHDKGDRQ